MRDYILHPPWNKNKKVIYPPEMIKTISDTAKKTRANYKIEINCQKCGIKVIAKTPVRKYCEKCSIEINKERKRVNPENRKKRIKKVGLLTEKQKEYQKLFLFQNGKCKICDEIENVKDKTGKVRKLAIDHNHKTNEIRGLLCLKCNTALGLVKDNINILQKMIDYLKENN